MRFSRFTAIALGGLAAIGLVSPAVAQNMAASPGMPGPFTDTRTGKVWTPSWDFEDPSQPTNPNHPVNREFNPRGQATGGPGMIYRQPSANLLATVPITAGPTVPIMMIDAPSLQAVPGQRWISILYVTNNSANAIDPIVDCHFTNNGQKVESVRVTVPPAGPGERLGLAIRGPRVDLFVDKVTCVPMSPL